MLSEKLFSFIKSSPCAYHAVETIKKRLLDNGFAELSHAEKMPEDGGKFFIIENGSSIIAFDAPKKRNGFMIVAAHSDSPAFKLKASAERMGAYSRLDVERYGGMIYSTWFDRPLSLAGRLLVKTDNGIRKVLTNLDKDAFVIPSVAIHLNRSVNDGYKYNPAVDLLPLSGLSGGKGIMEAVADSAGVCREDILGHDLFIYNRDEGKTLGKDGELILSPRLDDLACVFLALEAFLESEATDSVRMLAVFDNEEVGSETKEGAASSFFSDTVEMISGERRGEMLKNSMMLSADNAHAEHPNHPELSDAQNSPKLGGGVVIKYNANHRYATDGVSEALFRSICEKRGVKLQSYANRADIPGGSTLGSIANTRVGLPTVDIGLAQLGMHSACETAGVADLSEMLSAMTGFYSSSLEAVGDEIFVK